MGSLPDLTERARSPPRPAARTVSDPHRHRLHQQPPVSTVAVKEWDWKRSRAARAPAAAPSAPRRRDSACSSVGAASVRRLLRRAPPAPPPRALACYAALCGAHALLSAAALPLTAVAGAEDLAPALAALHAAAAAAAPLSPLLLRRLGARALVVAAHALAVLLLAAQAAGAPRGALYCLYAVVGGGLSPLSLAQAAAATGVARALADDEPRRRVLLRRALRSMRAARDAGLLAGALLLGGAVTLWPSAAQQLSLVTAPPGNGSAARWPPPEDYFQEDDNEELTCGASGCPDGGDSLALSALGARALFGAWAALALLGAALGAAGARAPGAGAERAPRARSPRPDDAPLAAPMALFIGLQEGFIYTSYIKWYAVCVSGWGAAWSALAGAGCLQAVAAATLSMAAARGHRGALAAGGAAAHACLLLALLRWRAARTDQALPAVAAAAWGACGALWDTLQTGAIIGNPGWRTSWSIVLSARHAGMAAACCARQFLCVRAQLATLAVSLALAMAAHAAREIRERRAAAAAEARQIQAPT